MIRQILTGGKGDKGEVLIVATNAAEIEKIKSVVKEAATEGDYEGFDYIEVWGRSTGVSRVIRLGRGAKKKAQKKADEAAPKKEEAKEKTPSKKSPGKPEDSAK